MSKEMTGARFKFFKFMIKNHNLVLIDQEIDEILYEVAKLDADFLKNFGIEKAERRKYIDGK